MMEYQQLVKNHQEKIFAVVPFSKGSDHVLALDLTSNNKDLTEELMLDTVLFSGYIDKLLSGAGARYAIGGYAEHRMMYGRSDIFNTVDEPRRLHLGMDIWGPALTPVMTPLDGEVHSFAFNDRFGDYGGTIILSHRLEGIVFYTLYGHLSVGSIRNLKQGNGFDGGDVIGEFGIPAENGHWPPHLHFQVMLDMEGWEGDYPGVCKFSERRRYLANCPDPMTLLGKTFWREPDSSGRLSGLTTFP